MWKYKTVMDLTSDVVASNGYILVLQIYLLKLKQIHDFKYFCSILNIHTALIEL